MNKLVAGGQTTKLYRGNDEQAAVNEPKEKAKKQRKRVGVNPVLGNAGVMWEPSKKVSFYEPLNYL